MEQWTYLTGYHYSDKRLYTLSTIQYFFSESVYGVKHKHIQLVMGLMEIQFLATLREQTGNCCCSSSYRLYQDRMKLSLSL